ncbi:MAG: hypothetical protein K2G70_01515 [Turicibacter sp.]|nr:hypothetical protein [Turicibacter sp.]
MGVINWGGFRFESNLLVEVKECCTCRERKPKGEILSNGMCGRCTEIENKLLERLAGKWGLMVLEQEVEQDKNGWSPWR